MRFVAAFSAPPRARDRVASALAGHDHEAIDAVGLAVAWTPTAAAERAEAEGVVCVLLRPEPGDSGEGPSASALASAFARGRVELTLPRDPSILVLWDRVRGRGMLAGDRLGVLAPVFRRSGGQVLAALEACDLLSLLESRPGPDERSVVRWLDSGSLDPRATLFDGIERLPGGHLLELRNNAAELRRHWRFEYEPPLEASREETEHELRSGLQNAVERRLGEGATTGILLSGGLDSAVVAGTATRLCGYDGLPSYSLVFPRHPQVDEQPFIEALTAELGLPSTLVPFRGGGLLDAGRAYIRTWHVPPASPNVAIQLPLLRRAATEGATTLLDGQGGDELFGASLYLLADLLRAGRPGRAGELARRISGIPEHLRGRAERRALYELGLKGALPPAAHALARRLWSRPTPPWLSARAAALHHSTSDSWHWKRRSGPRWWTALLDSVTEQRERAGAHEYLRHRNELAGIRGDHPLLQDVDLIRLVLRLPPELAFDRAVDRPLLRSAMAGIVPDVVRLRPDKSYFTPLFVEAMNGHDADGWRRLLAADDAAINEFTRRELVRAHLLEAPREHRGQSWAWAVWRLAMLEYWLRGELNSDAV